MKWTDLCRHDSNGYELFTDPDESHGRGHSITHHRLIMYGYGVLDGDELAQYPEPDTEIDHIISVPWLNYVENLRPIDDVEHAKVTRATVRRRVNRTRTLE